MFEWPYEVRTLGLRLDRPLAQNGAGQSPPSSEQSLGIHHHQVSTATKGLIFTRQTPYYLIILQRTCDPAVEGTGESSAAAVFRVNCSKLELSSKKFFRDVRHLPLSANSVYSSRAEEAGKKCVMENGKRYQKKVEDYIPVNNNPSFRRRSATAE